MRLLARKDLFAIGGEIGAVKGSLGAASAFSVTAALIVGLTLAVVAFEGSVGGLDCRDASFRPSEGQPLYQVFGQQVHSGSVVIALVGTIVVAALNIRPIASTATGAERDCGGKARCDCGVLYRRHLRR